MPPAQRRFDPGVVQQLLAEPYRFGFFQAVRVLERHFSRRGASGGAAVDEPVGNHIRFRSSLSLSFPPSEIEKIAAAYAPVETEEFIESEEGAESLSGPSDGGPPPSFENLREVELTPAFFGLLGSAGTLPLYYTERIAERETFQRDRATRAFFDIFLNRSAALLFKAWQKNRLEFQQETDPQARFLPLLLSIAGFGLPSLCHRLDEGEGAVHDEALAHYAIAMGQRPASATMLERVLGDYFTVGIRVEQFVGRWYAVPEPQRSRLGSTNVVLGRNALSGDRVWQRDLRVRIWIGPLTRREFEDFLPGGSCAIALKKLVTLLTGICLEYEIKLILKPDEVRGITLSAHREDGRLGWDAFMCTRPIHAPRSDASYQINPHP